MDAVLQQRPKETFGQKHADNLSLLQYHYYRMNQTIPMGFEMAGPEGYDIDIYN